MLETFQSDHSRDFRQRYAGSFGYYKDDNKRKIFVLISNVGDLEVSFVDEKENVYSARADSGIEFEFIPVKKKLFVHRDELLYIRRRPARMWARGINPQNTEVSNVLVGKDQTLNFAKVVAYLKTCVDVKLNIQKLEEKNVSAVVLSDLFGTTNGSLYLYDKVVGDFRPDTREIVVTEPLFHQEIEDLVAKTEIPYRVRT